MSRMTGAKRREQLLDTALNLFSLYGYAGATTAQIARESGVTEPIIYRHFKSKRDLFIALIDRTGQETIRLWNEAIGGAKDPAHKLRKLIGTNPLVASRGRGAYRVIVQAMTEVEDPEIRHALHQHIEKLHEFVTRVVKDAQASGMVSSRFSPALTAWALIHIGLGYGVLAPLHIPHHAVDETGKHIQDLLGELMLGERYHKSADAE